MAPSRRKKNPKADLHITINPVLIEYFEVLRPIHGREYSEFVEEKIFALISEIAPEKILELQLEAAEKKVTDIKQAMVEAKLLKSIDLEIQKAKNEQDQINDDLDSRLETMRNTKYEENKKSMAYQIKKRTIDWKVIMNVFGFKTQLETKDFVTEKLSGEGLI